MGEKRFYAKINQGIMHNRGRGTSRLGRWIDARDIPLDYLKEEYGVPKTSKIHPHNIEGMAWDLDKHSWKIAKNARSHSIVVDLVTYDPDDPRTFYK